MISRTARAPIAFLFPLLIPAASMPAAAPEAASGGKVPRAVESRMEETRTALLDRLKAVDEDVFRPGKSLARDELVLEDGSVVAGKVLDYGAYVCCIDGTGRRVIPRGRIRKLTLAWAEPAPAKPRVADLDVTYIERLPRYRGNHGNVGYDPKEKGIYLLRPNADPLWPPAGMAATFKGHVVNKGPVESAPFEYEWSIDGKREAGGTSRGLKAAEEIVLDFPWRWQDGAHTVTLRVAPGGGDFCAWNDRRSDRTDSLGFCIVAARSTRDGFDGVLNMVESFSYEDWVQRHMEVMNFLFAASIHPGSPEGCFERVRVDMMATYADDEYAKKFETTAVDEQGHMFYEGKWGFSPWDNYGERAASMDWGLIHELGHQLGLIDYYTLDFWRYSIFARDREGNLIDVGYSYPEMGMMRSHGPHPFEEASAIALNWERGKHRGYYGDYLFRLPAECGLRILDAAGHGLPAADVRVFRRTAGVHTDDAARVRIPEDPVFDGKTDADGVFMLPNEKPPFEFTTGNGFTRGPSPFGDALVICDTGLMLIEVWKGDRRDIRFTDVTRFQIAFGRGHERTHIEDIPTILPGEDDRVKPPRLHPVETDGWCDRLRIRWENVPGNTATRFRVYAYLDGLPLDAMYRTELATVRAEGPFALSVLHLNGWVTMTGIDDAGRESAPAVPEYAGWRFFGKLAADSRHNVYFATEASVQRIEPSGAVRPCPMRSRWEWRGAWPPAAVAVGPGDELFVLSREYCGVSVQGGDGLERRHFGEKGGGEGQLSAPADIDMDAAGNVYIADTGNDRIAVFASGGTFARNVAQGKIAKPAAVAVHGDGNLCVIERQKPGVVRIAWEGGAYRDPVRLAATKVEPSDIAGDGEGRIYIAQNAEPGLLVLDGDGTTIAALDRWGEESTREITGLARDRAGNLVCALGNRGKIIRIPAGEIVKRKA